MDEAHSSQSGDTARELKAILGVKAKSGEDGAVLDFEDILNQVMQSRGVYGFLSQTMPYGDLALEMLGVFAKTPQAA